MSALRINSCKMVKKIYGRMFKDDGRRFCAGLYVRDGSGCHCLFACGGEKGKVVALESQPVIAAIVEQGLTTYETDRKN